jgi:hypothetical protein
MPTREDSMTASQAIARRSFHPLEMFPFFSRWAPGPVRDFIYSFIFNTLIALVFTALAVLFSTGSTSAASFG